MNKLLLCIGLVSLVPLQTSAACQRGIPSHTDYMQCLDQQLTQTKRELTSWENNHLFQLEEQASSTGRKDGLKLFNKARQSFELYTEQDCRWQFIRQLPNDDAAGASYKECQLSHLKQRIELLKQVHMKAN